MRVNYHSDFFIEFSVLFMGLIGGTACCFQNIDSLVVGNHADFFLRTHESRGGCPGKAT